MKESNPAAGGPEASPAAGQVDRRTAVKCAAGAIGTTIMAVPVGVAGYAFLDPVLRGTSDQQAPFVRVALLDEVPADGTPKRFEVRADQWDKWTFVPQAPVGAVFLRRDPQTGKIATALHTTCPHLGCSVDLRQHDKGLRFVCPCHDSAFELDGTIIQPSPSPRPLDSLAVEERDGPSGKEVWVQFVNYRVGRADKVRRA
jgi:menaquinol-cytochrome c reductase iron-sulfur subunit